MKRNSGSGERSGLLDREESIDLFCAQRGAEKQISEPVFKRPVEDSKRQVVDPLGEEDAGDPFLRTPQRVSVRRRRSPKFASKFASRFGGNRWARLLAVAAAVMVFGLLMAAFVESKSLLLRNPRFLLTSEAQNIQVTGNRVVTAPEALAIFASDVGRSVFHVPLARRQSELEKIPWVRAATVMRLWPDRLRVALVERTPVAFVRDGDAVRLIDDQGVMLALPNAASQHYSFPVLSGISASDPAAVRAAKVQRYLQFAKALDAEGGRISAGISEVDLSDTEDIRAIFAAAAHQPLVHFGDSDFLPRYVAYQSHLAEWLRQYPQLRSVDMRYGAQVVLDTGTVKEAAADIPANAATPTADEANGTEAKPKIKTVKANGEHRQLMKPPAAKGHPARPIAHRAAVRRHSAKKKPSRGHIVRHPIMHVVTGI